MSDDRPRTPRAWADYYVQWGWLIFPVWWIGPDGECACPGEPILDDDGAVARDKDGRIRKKNCRPGKHPIPKNGLKAASNDPAKIEAWWTSYPDANIGLATGKDTGLVVIDADGPAGIAAVAALDLPPTVTARSGSGVGQHYFFTHPGDVDLPNWARAHADLAGVDFRGDGGFIILPPSNHASGGSYQWIDGPKTTKFARLPETFIDLYCTGAKAAGDGAVHDDDPEYVEEGRNVYLTRKAGQLRRGGLDDERILADLRWMNERKCRPPLPDEELVRIATNIGRKPTGDPGPVNMPTGPLGDALSRHAGTPLAPILVSAALNDHGNAECCEFLHPNEFRFCKDKGKSGVWFWWTGTHWTEDKSARVERAMVATIHKRAEAAALLPKKGDRGKLFKHCESSLNISKIRAALGSLSTFANMQAAISDFDKNGDLIGTNSGTLDLLTGELRPSAQADMISRVLGVDYDPLAQSPQWETFISDIMGGDAELAAYLQRIVGYSLTGSIKEQVFFVFHGLGANGKSTFLSILGELFGQYAATAAFDSFDADAKSTNSNDLARLRAVRMLSCIESEHNRRLAEGRIKSITGGDVISCRFLFAEFFEYVPQFKMILAVNHRPLIRGSDQGIWRRVQLIPFEESFSGPRDDKNLRAKLATELPGILNWALHGLGEWRRIGLAPPQRVRDAVESYRQESDQLTRWLEDSVKFEPKASEPVAAVYQAYRSWAMENGERAWSSIQLAQRLKEKGYDRPKTRGAPSYKGFKLVVKEVSIGSFGSGQFHNLEDAG